MNRPLHAHTNANPHAHTNAQAGRDFGFESRLAKIARVLTGQYGIEVTFAPDGPRVEPGRIVVPDYAVTDEASKDLLTGYLDLLAARTSAKWHTLPWRDKFVWRVERALWDEVPQVKEHSTSLDVSLASVGEMMAAAHAARSTDESIDLAQRLVARVRQLSAGNVNNMMLTADADETLDGEAVSSESDTAAEGTPAADASPAAGMAEAPSNPLADPTEGIGEHAPVASVDGRPLLSVPLTTQFDLVTDLTGHGDPAAWRNLRALARADTAPLKARLERALKADEQTHWRVEQERGALDRRALAKLATSPGYRTPFRTMRVTPGRDTAVTLLIDRSGSMAGKKMELARLCAAALCDALVELDFACEVLGYSSIEDAGMRAFCEQQRARGVPLHRYNRLVERLDFQVYKRFGSNDMKGIAALECGHENPDGEALAWAARRLADKRAGRRILLVLSDGYPATGDGHPAILRTDLRLRVAAIERAGIELIGLGILDDAVESFYPTSVVVRHLHELPNTALRILGERLLQR